MAASQAAAAGAASGAEVHKDIIICDNGTGYLKAGFGGENIPQYVYPSLVGRPMMRAEEDVLDGVELKVCSPSTLQTNDAYLAHACPACHHASSLWPAVAAAGLQNAML